MSLVKQEVDIEALIDEAELYRCFDLKPLPLHDGKSPKAKDWQLREFTAKQFRSYLQKAKVPGVGVQLGPVSGIVDFEWDDEAQRECFYDLFDGDVPEGPAFTSTHGEHRLFAWDDRLEELGVANLRIPCGEGEPLIFRVGAAGKGSQSAFPPSPGKAWKPGLAFGECSITQLPESVIAKLLALAKKPATAEPVASELATPAMFKEAVAAMILRHPPREEESDGSKRLHDVCCRCVEFGLDEQSVVAAVRQYAERCPFPRTYSDEQILDRFRDAGRRPDCVQGSALTPGQYHLTDLGNAERFAAQHKDDLRFVHAWKSWIIWNGGRWQIDESGVIYRRATSTVRAMYEEAATLPNKADREELAKHAATCESRHKLEAMEAVARNVLPMPIRYSDLNQNPYLLNCSNGTVDLRTGLLREHRREDFITKKLDVEYPATTEGVGLWLKFLHEIFDGDDELIRFVQRIMGYAIVGEVTEHIMPIFHGSGSNGKSTFTTACVEILGEYAMTLGQEYLMQMKRSRHSTENMDLYGIRLAVSAETEEGARLNEARVKHQTGGGKIRGRRLYQESWEFDPSHTFVLETNHRPRIDGTDHGIWRRVLLIPFTVQIADEDQDKKLPDKLRAIKPAILRWMVEGCLEWQRIGLCPPEKVVAATAKYREESDLFAEFLAECCEVAPGKQVRASELYESYAQRAKERGEFPQAAKRISERMEALNYAKGRIRTGHYVYRGIALKLAYGFTEVENSNEQ